MEGKIQSGAETRYVNKTTHEQKVPSINATAAMETTNTRVFVQQWGKPVIFVINKTTSQPHRSDGNFIKKNNYKKRQQSVNKVEMGSRNDTANTVSEDQRMSTCLR